MPCPSSAMQSAREQCRCGHSGALHSHCAAMACRTLLARAIAPLSAATLSMPQLCRAVPTCALLSPRSTGPSICALSTPWRRRACLINACAVLRRALQCLALAGLASVSRASAVAMLMIACALPGELLIAMPVPILATLYVAIALRTTPVRGRAVSRAPMPAHWVAVRRIACARSSTVDLRRRCAELCSASAMLPAALPVRGTGSGCYASASLSLALLRRCEGPKRVALPPRCSADRCCAVPARLYAMPCVPTPEPS